MSRPCLSLRITRSPLRTVAECSCQPCRGSCSRFLIPQLKLREFIWKVNPLLVRGGRGLRFCSGKVFRSSVRIAMPHKLLLPKSLPRFPFGQTLLVLAVLPLSFLHPALCESFQLTDSSALLFICPYFSTLDLSLSGNPVGETQTSVPDGTD